MRGWMIRIGLLLSVGGMLALGSTMWPAPADDVAVTASHGAEGAPPDPEEPEDTSWRDAVRVAGGIVLVAGAGLLLLAVLPGRVERD